MMMLKSLLAKETYWQRHRYILSPLQLDHQSL